MNRVGFVFGAAFGFVIAAAGLNNYDVIHRMLLLQELDVYLLMGSAVAVAAPLLWLLERSRWRTPLAGPIAIERRPIKRNTVLGAIVFGTGWAISGACPGPALAMVAAGSIPALAVVLGLMAGVVAHDRVVARAVSPSEPVPPGSCAADGMMALPLQR